MSCLSGTRFLVADGERNMLAVYDASTSGAPMGDQAACRSAPFRIESA